MTPKEEAICRLTGYDSIDDLDGEAIHVRLKIAMAMYDEGRQDSENAFTIGYDAGVVEGKDARDRFYSPILKSLTSDIEERKNDYIKEMRWADGATDHAKTLVVGNLNGFVGYLNSIAATGFSPKEIEDAGMFANELVNGASEKAVLCELYGGDE